MSLKPARTDEAGAARVLAAGARVTLLGHVVGRGFGFLLTLILARWLGANDFGVFFLALAIAHFAGTLADVGLKSGMLRFVAIGLGKNDAGWVRAVVRAAIVYGLCASLAVGAVLAFSAGTLARAFDQPALRWILPLMALALPASVLAQLSTSGLQACKAMGSVALLRNVIEPLARIVVFLLLAAFGWRLAAAVLGYAAAAGLTLVVSLLWLAGLIPPRGPAPPPHLERDLLVFSAPLAFANISGFALEWTGTIALSTLMDARDVGIYSAANRLTSLGGITLFVVSTIFGPQVNELWGRCDLGAVRDLYQQCTRWLVTVNVPIFCLTVLWADPLLRLFGAEFTREGNHALIVLALGMLLNAATGPAGDLVLMAGKSRLALYNAFIAGGVGILANWAFIRWWGMTGAAVASALAVVLNNLGNVVIAWRATHIHPYTRKMLKPLAGAAAAALMLLALTGGRAAAPADFVLQFLGWALLYPLLLWGLGLEKEDRGLWSRAVE